MHHRHLIKQTADWFELHRLSTYDEEWRQVPTHKKNWKEGGGCVKVHFFLPSLPGVYGWVTSTIFGSGQAGRVNKQSTYIDVYDIHLKIIIMLYTIPDILKFYTLFRLCLLLHNLVPDVQDGQNEDSDGDHEVIDRNELDTRPAIDAKATDLHDEHVIVRTELIADQKTLLMQ